MEVNDRYGNLDPKEKQLKRLTEKRDFFRRFSLISASEYFSRDLEIHSMRKRINLHFQEPFMEAYECYILGDWLQAKVRLEQTLRLKPGDGPSLTLLHYIRDNGYRSPPKWKGFR